MANWYNSGFCSALYPMFQKIKNTFRLLYKRLISVVDRRPLISFFALLVLFLGLIILSNFLKRTPDTAQEAKVAPKGVQVYTIGSAPRVRFQAQIEKSGVVTITALTGGVVQALNVEPGDIVNRGDTLVSLTSNYHGGNAFTVQRQIAQTQYNNVKDTYDAQRDVINKQKEVANKGEESSIELREISERSLQETRGLLDLNSEILNTLESNLNQYTATNSAGINDALILQTRSLRSQFLSANIQLNSALRNTEYTSNNDQEPAQIGRLQRDIAVKQLEIQEKALDLNKEISRLQAQVAAINEALMYPSAPFTASVERVFVKVGQAVQPGTPLLVLSQPPELDPIVAIAYVPRDIAVKVSQLEPSTLYIGNFTYEAYPAYVTRDAVQGSLHGVYFDVPDNYYSFVTEKGYVQIDIPIGTVDTSATVPFIPLDAVYQTKDKSYVYVINKGNATSKSVKLGDVFGRYVEVETGLNSGDRIIINRNVTDGDAVKVSN